MYKPNLNPRDVMISLQTLERWAGGIAGHPERIKEVWIVRDALENLVETVPRLKAAISEKRLREAERIINDWDESARTEAQKCSVGLIKKTFEEARSGQRTLF